jgi:hypothetical protein
MGYIVNHGMIVTSWDAPHANIARQKVFDAFDIEGLGQCVGEVLIHPINGGASFFVAPDGSKEGWDTSDAGDRARSAAIVALRGCELVDWAAFALGEDWDDWEFQETSCKTVCKTDGPSLS